MPRRIRPRDRERPRSRPVPEGTFRAEASATFSVFRRLAVRDATGHIARCWPTVEELRDGAVPQRKGRIGYRTEADAGRAADELARIEGAAPRRVVACRCTVMLGGEHYHLVVPLPST